MYFFNLSNVSKILTMIKKVAITFVVDKESKIEDVTKIIDKISECLGKDTEIYYNVETENLEQISQSLHAPIHDKIKAISWFTGLTEKAIAAMALEIMEENDCITFNEALDRAFVNYYNELMEEWERCCNTPAMSVVYENFDDFKKSFDFKLQMKYLELANGKYKEKVEKILHI